MLLAGLTPHSRKATKRDGANHLFLFKIPKQHFKYRKREFSQFSQLLTKVFARGINEGSVEEERRLAYVGITRAQRELIFTYARERRQFGEVSRTEASRFLHELPQDDLNWELGQVKKTEAHKEQSNKQGMAGLRAQLAKAKEGKK